MTYIPFGRDNKLQSYLYDNAVKNNINSSITQINTQITNINNAITNINTEIASINDKFPTKVITTETKNAPITAYQYLSYTIPSVDIGNVINIKCCAPYNASGYIYMRFGNNTYYTYTIDSSNYFFTMTCIIKSIGTTNTIFLAQVGSYANVDTTTSVTPNVLITLTNGSVVYGEIEYIKNI